MKSSHLLILIALILIGGMFGWTIYIAATNQPSHPQTVPVNTSASSTSNPEKPPSSETSTPPLTPPTPSSSTNTLPKDWITYENKTANFQISYPQNYSIKVDESLASSGFSYLGKPLLEIDAPKTVFKGTNLQEALVLISSSSSPLGLANCNKLSSFPTENSDILKDEIIIHDIPFYTGTRVGAAAGNRYASQIYRTAYRNTCIEINLLLHSTNIENYPAGSIQPFDAAAMEAKLQSILYTFQFLSSSQ